MKEKTKIWKEEFEQSLYAIDAEAPSEPHPQYKHH